MKMRLVLSTADRRMVFFPFEAKNEAAAQLIQQDELKKAESNFKEPLTLVRVERVRKRPPPTRTRHGMAFGIYQFQLADDGVVVHKKSQHRSKDFKVPFELVATGGGMEFELEGKRYRVAWSDKGLLIRKLEFGARSRLLNWKRIAWFAGVEMEAPDQLEWKWWEKATAQSTPKP